MDEINKELSRKAQNDRLQLIKALSKLNGSDIKYMANLMLLKESAENFTPLKDGERVKIDYDKLTKLRDFPKMQERYKQFIADNRDRIFTVKTYKKYEPDNMIVTFKEDNTWDFTEVMLIRLDSDRYGNKI